MIEEDVGSARSAARSYVEIARIDHWFKNVFVVLRIVVAVFFQPGLRFWTALPTLGLALLAACLVSSCNYVPNEILVVV